MYGIPKFIFDNTYKIPKFFFFFLYGIPKFDSVDVFAVFSLKRKKFESLQSGKR